MAGRLLIADRVAANRVVLKVRLAAASYGVGHAASAAELLEAVAADHPDLVLVDVNIAEDGLDRLCSQVRRRSGQARLPILVTASEGAPITAAQVLEAGADDLVRRPIVDALLMARVRSLLRMRDTVEEAARRRQTAEQLGCAEPGAAFDMPARLVLVGAANSRPGPGPAANLPARTRVLSDRQILDLGPDQPAPEVVVLPVSAETAGDRALPLLAELRSRAATRHAAILVLVPPGQPRLAAQALDLGAGDVASTLAPSDEIARRVQRLVALKREADSLRRTIDDGLRIAATDPLTGLHNRRYAEYHVARIDEAARTTGHPYAVILADIDHFKRINDTHGHGVGDLVLKAVAERLQSALRGADLVARIGGEEFLAVLPDTAPSAAAAVAYRLADAVRGRPVTLPGGSTLQVTASFGVAFAPPQPAGETLVDRADRALYRAKRDGRDRVELDSAAPPAQPELTLWDQGLLGGRRKELSSRSA